MKDRKFLIIGLGVCFSGIMIFYLYPFLDGFIKTLSGNEAGFFGKYKVLMRNPSLLLALKNTILFTIISVSVINLFSFNVALVLWRIPKKIYFMTLILPLAIPVISTASAWMFILKGISSELLYGQYSMVGVILIYTWKYSGFHILVYYSGICSVPQSHWDAAAIDGASTLRYVKSILIPETRSFTIFNLFFAVLHSFLIFRDIYLLFGNYPPENMYLLQHFIQNSYVRLQYDDVLCAGYVFSGIVMLFFIPLFYRAHKEGSFLDV